MSAKSQSLTEKPSIVSKSTAITSAETASPAPHFDSKLDRKPATILDQPVFVTSPPPSDYNRSVVGPISAPPPSTLLSVHVSSTLSATPITDSISAPSAATALPIYSTTRDSPPTALPQAINSSQLSVSSRIKKVCLCPS